MTAHLSSRGLQKVCKPLPETQEDMIVIHIRTLSPSPSKSRLALKVHGQRLCSWAIGHIQGIAVFQLSNNDEFRPSEWRHVVIPNTPVSRTSHSLWFSPPWDASGTCSEDLRIQCWPKMSFSYSIIHCSHNAKKLFFNCDISLVTPQLFGEVNQLTDTVGKRGVLRG